MEEARLKSTDPSKEKRRLQRIAAQLSALSAHLVECDRALGDAVTTTLANLQIELVRRKAAADLASHRSFDCEPLRGVGTEAWRDLWEAARRFIASVVVADDAYGK